MKKLFKKTKYIVLGIAISLALITPFASADSVTNLWYKNSSSSMYTNVGNGLANADIHVAHCYIGTGNTTPCAAGAGVGTVTDFSFTDGNGFVGTVTNSSSTPNLSLTTSLTQGSVPFINSAGGLAQDNSNFFYDATNHRLGIGTATPVVKLDVHGDALINGLTLGRGTGNLLSNTIFGDSAFTSNTTGFNNVSVGQTSMVNNTTGQNNVAIGVSAANGNTTGIHNVAIGVSSLNVNHIGSFNTAVGKNSLSTVSGSDNTGLGWQSGTTITTGTDNTMIGYNTGAGVTTGNYNTIIGASVSGLSSSLSNNIILADGAGNQRINVDSSGNVLVGTLAGSGTRCVQASSTGVLSAASAACGTGSGVPASPNTSIQFNNSGSFGGDSSLTWDNTNKQILLGNGTASHPSLSFILSPGDGVYSSSSNNLDFATGGVDVARFTPAGNLGIGTSLSSTAFPIDVRRSTNGPQSIHNTNSSTGSLAEASFALMNDSNTGDVKGELFLNGGNNTNYGGANSLNLYDYNSNGALTFGTGAANPANERMRITGTGLVGIGTTAPAVTLDVSGDFRVIGLGGDTGFETASATTWMGDFNSGGNGTTLRVDDGSQLITLNGDFDNDILSNFDINGNNAQFQFNSSNSTNDAWFINGDTDDFKLGINRISPTVALDVFGDVHIADNDYSNGIFDIHDGNGTVSIGDYTGQNSDTYITVDDPDESIQIKASNILNFGTFGAGSHTGTPAYGLSVDSSGNVIETSLPTTTVGFNRSTGNTAANTNVLTYTVGASDESLQVSSNILVTTSVAYSFTETVTYKDETNTGRVLTLSFNTLAGTITPTITGSGGASPYEGVGVHIRALAGSTVTFATTGTFTSVGYNVEGTVVRLH